MFPDAVAFAAFIYGFCMSGLMKDAYDIVRSHIGWRGV